MFDLKNKNMKIWCELIKYLTRFYHFNPEIYFQKSSFKIIREIQKKMKKENVEPLMIKAFNFFVQNR